MAGYLDKEAFDTTSTDGRAWPIGWLQQLVSYGLMATSESSAPW